jgi:hypothetical protein
VGGWQTAFSVAGARTTAIKGNVLRALAAALHPSELEEAQLVQWGGSNPSPKCIYEPFPPQARDGAVPLAWTPTARSSAARLKNKNTKKSFVYNKLVG